MGADLEGLVQINLRGRERNGIVEPGAAYEALCEEIASGLASFTDADSGTPLIAEVIRKRCLWPEADRRRDLCDLLVRWAARSPVGLRMVRSPRYGAFVNPHAGGLADGRSGHHLPTGWLIGAGAGTVAGSVLEDAHATDLTATLHCLLGVPVPRHVRGTPIAGVCNQVSRCARAAAS